jgi:DNA-binding winged helix-turn-helix (wHTH) protein/tetratricopeptide (TPR) repeat protein
MLLQSNHLYRFDEFELQPSRRALLRGGERVPVAPKSFEVLLCLVQHSGRVVLKEEILETVWPGAFVEEGNLTQHIFWLRKALGDKSGYIVTIPGTGYEFTGMVESSPDSAGGPQQQRSSQPPISFTLEETVERTQIVVEETTLSETPAVKAKWGMRTKVAAALLVVAAVASAAAWRWTHGVVAGDHHEVVLADFDNTTHDADFDRSLKTLLSIDLNQSPFLLVVGENDTRKVMNLMNLPADAALTPAVAREVCERLNDQVVLAGRLAQIGRRYLVTVDATDCSDGRILAQTRGIADSKEGVINAVDTASGEMRRKLGEPLRSKAGGEEPLPLKHTFSLDALKAYSRARALHQRLKFAEAVPLYQKAIELDPNFADAYAQLGNCFNNMGEALEGRKAMARAYELRDQADEQDRLRIVAMYEYWRTGDRHQAIRNYQNWTRLYPLGTNPWVLLGEFQASVGRMDLAVDAAKHAVANNPNSVSSRQDLAEWQRYDGQLDAARTTCLDALRHGLESVSIHRTLLDVAYLQRNSAEFEEQRKWFRDKAEEDERESMEADLDGSQGRMRSAVAHWEHLAELQTKDGLKEAALEVFSGVPDMEADFGMTKEAKAHLQRFEPPVPLVGASLTSVIMAAAEVGNLKLAEGKLKYILDNGKEDSDVQELFAPEGRAAIAIASGKGDQAVAAMLPSLPYELTDPSAAMMRGAAYLAARKPELAQKEFQVIIDRPYISGISPNVALAHLSLARALVMEGNHDAAKQEYSAFLTMLRDADPDLPVVTQARQEYLHLR